MIDINFEHEIMTTTDAVILAGEKADAIPVLGENKAFLPFRGRPLIAWSIDALDRAETIGSITVVGPLDKLKAKLTDVKTQKPLKFKGQGENVFDNILQGGFSTFPEYREGMTSAELKAVGDARKAVFGLTSDLPLLEPVEVDDFIRTAPLDRADIVYGFTRQELLEPFEAREGRPGVTFMYFCFKDSIVRHSNVFLYRPLALAGVLEDLTPIIYRLRYQRHFRNVAALGKEVVKRALNPETIQLFLLMQTAKAAHRHGLIRLRELARRSLAVERVAANVSKVFETATAYHETIGPGPTLDVDDDEIYRTLNDLFDEWKAIQMEQIERALAGG